MRILLDESLPAHLRSDLPGHEILTVPSAGWAGKNNAKLLRLIAESRKSDVFLTMKKKSVTSATTQRPPVCRRRIAGYIEAL